MYAASAPFLPLALDVIERGGGVGLSPQHIQVWKEGQCITYQGGKTQKKGTESEKDITIHLIRWKTNKTIHNYRYGVLRIYIPYSFLLLQLYITFLLMSDQHILR